MNDITLSEDLQFLNSEGEMGALISNKNWANTPLGNIAEWSSSLKTCLNIMLNTKSPMLLTWGDDLICFYNDVFRESLGTTGKHPSNLGVPAIVFWSEIWEEFGPALIKLKQGGNATWNSNQFMPLKETERLKTPIGHMVLAQ